MSTQTPSKTDLVVGSNAGRSRSHNRQVVLGAVRAAGRIGRAEIARASGLSIQAVSNIIADLEADGMLIKQGRRGAGRGQPAVQYALDPMGGYAFGFEVRPDAVFAALLDLHGQPIFSHRIAITSADPATVARNLAGLQTKAIESTGIEGARLLGAGVVMPGPFGQTGLSGNQSDLPGWQDIAPQQWFAETLNLPTLVENDANAAALAERVSGAAKGLQSYAYLYFGAGLGLGVVTSGHILRGAYGNAGEIGHLLIGSGDTARPIEAFVSRLSVQRRLNKAGVVTQSGADLETLYRAQNPALLGWLSDASAPLSQAVHIIENLFDPEAIILGGAMPDVLLDHLIAHVPLPERSVSNRKNRTGPRLLRGASGRMTAVLGAASLVINQTFTPQIAASP